jgi:hypothetical protein
MKRIMQSLIMGLAKRAHWMKINMSNSSLLPIVAGYPVRRLKRFLHSRALSKADSLIESFTLIYSRNLWGSKESVSGSGSTLAMTESIRELLKVLIAKFEIKTIFDAPCGDFNWMSKVDLRDVIYIGGDIVEPLVLDLQRNFTSDNVSFIQVDITKDKFPKSDLVLNRDCLFHLSYADILSTLGNFLTSKSKYFLSTSYENVGQFLNSNIQSGDFRLIDLLAAPFSFPKEFYFEIPEQGEASLPPRKLYLWDREQVQVAHSNLERYLSGL